MKVLVTGGTGFIGSHLIDKLIDNKHDVWSIDDYSGGSYDNERDEAHYIIGDLRDAEWTSRQLNLIKPEIVFHLAANAAENKAQFSPIDITSRNYSAFINTLTPFIRCGGRRFVFTSSIAVYGALQTPFKEDDKPEPEDLYGITKLAAEQTLKIMSKVHGFEYVITRPHNVYGPRQNMRDPYRNVVTIWMNKLMKGEPTPIYGDGKQKRCFSYINDVIDALYKCGFYDVNGMTFNIGADEYYSLNELFKAFKESVGVNIECEYLPERLQEVKNAIADHTQAKNYLNYISRQSLIDGLKYTWDWVEKQGPQEPIYTDLEIPSSKAPKNWKK